MLQQMQVTNTFGRSCLAAKGQAAVFEVLHGAGQLNAMRWSGSGWEDSVRAMRPQGVDGGIPRESQRKRAHLGIHGFEGGLCTLERLVGLATWFYF